MPDAGFVVGDYLGSHRTRFVQEKDGLRMTFEAMHRPLEDYFAAMEAAGLATEPFASRGSATAVAGTACRCSSACGQCGPDRAAGCPGQRLCAAAVIAPRTWRMRPAARSRSGWPASSHAITASTATVGASWAAQLAQAGSEISEAR